VRPIPNEAKIPSMNVRGSEPLTREIGPYAFSMLANAEAQSKRMIDYAIRARRMQEYRYRQTDMTPQLLTLRRSPEIPPASAHGRRVRPPRIQERPRREER
jgi:hypothetical protein